MCGCVLARTHTQQLSRVQLGDPADFSPPGSSIHGNFQARILEWVAISTPGGLPKSRIKPMSPASPALQMDSLPLRQLGSPYTANICAQ